MHDRSTNVPLTSRQIRRTKMLIPTFAKEFLALGSIFAAGYMWSFIL